jgi:hypothetical protein
VVNFIPSGCEDLQGVPDYLNGRLEGLFTNSKSACPMRSLLHTIMTTIANDKPTLLIAPQPSDNPALDVDQGPSPPPDGGFWAWMQCVGGFCIFFNTWGMLNSFGISFRGIHLGSLTELGTFQAFYERDFLKTSTASQISWIGTVQSSFIMLGSLYSGPLYDCGYLGPLMWIGSIVLTLGVFLTSLCTRYWHVLLAQGIMMGLGTGCLFTPTTGLIASYFGKKRGLAMGIVSTGSTIGSFFCF